MNEAQRSTDAKSWPDYRAVWRWHFYASLFCIPFVIILSISGATYLFKEEVENWQDRPYDRLEIVGKSATAAAQIRAALAAVPDSSLDGYEIPKANNAASRVLVRRKRPGNPCVCPPRNLASASHRSRKRPVHGFRQKNSRRAPRRRPRLDGSGVSGVLDDHDDRDRVVSLVATTARGLGGVLYPRLGGGRRMFWRDLHGVTGIWISSSALFLLLSGLPWAKSWGNYLKAARRLTGTAVARQDWSNGSEGGNAAGGDGEFGHARPPPRGLGHRSRAEHRRT